MWELSRYTMGIGVAVASNSPMGAQVIEKHFADSRAKGGVDSSFSMEPAELKSLVIETELAWRENPGEN
ncbi:MAG: N-acetylneuraminate synthase family protein [Bdellovibrionota bacterium]